MTVHSNSTLIMRNVPDLLSVSMERRLFTRMNKYTSTISRLEDLPRRTPSQSAQLGAARRNRRIVRHHLIEANMALVLSVANRFTCLHVSYDEQVAAGLEKLGYCVDRFDVQRGYKFSTYAVRSLWHLYVQMNRVENKHHQDRVEADPIVIDQCNEAPHQGPDPDELIDLREVLQDNKANLSASEIKVLSIRFGLDSGIDMTLKQVGEQVNLTKERVRQIQRGALAKLRKSMQL